MKNQEVQKLVGIAEDFREGILQGKPSKATCFMICSALVGYLKFEGFYCELVEGQIGEWNHFWISLPSGNILDPTADQFKTPDNQPMPKVYYGKKPNWYIPLSEAIKEMEAEK